MFQTFPNPGGCLCKNTAGDRHWGEKESSANTTRYMFHHKQQGFSHNN
jgi:hypothetical protein